MRITNIEVNGFRSLLHFSISFENDLTVIVGENDAGKTSLIDCLKVITQGKRIEIDDFNHDMDNIQIKVSTEEFRFIKCYSKSEDNISEEPLTAVPTLEYIASILEWLSSDELDLDDGGTQEKIKVEARTLGLAVRSNSNVSNLKQQVVNLLSEDNVIIQEASFPSFNNIQLDGKHFENVSGFFKEVFLKGKQSEIWNEKINDDQTIEEFVKDRIDSYSELIEQDIQEKGILERMQLFINDLTEVKIEPIYQKKDLNIDAKVKFLENGREVSIDKKGDGTKRRISMALLEYKKEQSLLDYDDSTIYLLDEPDTHLHVKAQIEFLETLRSFSVSGSQVILTTHSPFIINAVCPKQLRLLENIDNHSKIRYLRDDSYKSDKVLRSIGIENTYLFFSRHIIIVEGETEEKFLPSYFLNKFDEALSSSLIKIINCKGIPNIPGFAKAILEIHSPDNIHLLYDNDASPELAELIDRLEIPAPRNYVVGVNEFEDAFSNEALYKAWAQYLIDHHRDIPESWNVDSIAAARAECQGVTGKFSKKIRSLNQGGKKMSKPIFGAALGEFLENGEIPQRVLDLIDAVRQV
ncbi:AAA family ATPase [Neptunomonas phycophila]|uniref:AAA family ATPase n=1 Tax=Neptunomonas phycophila TaxID=1572645 RepID=A0AAW7XGT6_9GAMM|nr:AAA family ATPase [Neptunomonas phycophila]MDO6452802.1 AAA family ATPase [Neptunomonas phycophila]